jgi:hypothetical protein
MKARKSRVLVMAELAMAIMRIRGAELSDAQEHALGALWADPEFWLLGVPPAERPN